MSYEINLLELAPNETDKASPKTAKAWLEYFAKINLFNRADVREVERQMRRHTKDAEEIKRMNMRDDIGIAGVVLSYAKTKYLQYFNELSENFPQMWFDYDPTGRRCDMTEEIRQDIRKVRTLEGLKVIIFRNSKVVRGFQTEPKKNLWQKMLGK